MHLQADKRWSLHVLGGGPATIGRAGCVLVSIANAYTHLTGNTLDPVAANARMLACAAFFGGGAALVVPDACAELGLRAGRSVDGVAAREDVLQVLASGGVSLVRIDHTGDSRGDHTVLAVVASGRTLQCWDPAVGELALPLDETIAVKWGARKKWYRVVGARGVWA